MLHGHNNFTLLAYASYISSNHIAGWMLHGHNNFTATDMNSLWIKNKKAVILQVAIFFLYWWFLHVIMTHTSPLCTLHGTKCMSMCSIVKIDSNFHGNCSPLEQNYVKMLCETWHII